MTFDRPRAEEVARILGNHRAFDECAIADAGPLIRELLGEVDRLSIPDPAPPERTSRTMTRGAFVELLDENRAWLATMPRTLEREHIDLILRRSVDAYYPAKTLPVLLAEATKEKDTEILALRAQIAELVANGAKAYARGHDDGSKHREAQEVVPK